jgi:hypothetical protein
MACNGTALLFFTDRLTEVIYIVITDTEEVEITREPNRVMKKEQMRQELTNRACKSVVTL